MTNEELFKKIKGWYPNEWNLNRVWNVTEKGAITEVQYKELTGFTYPDKE